MRLPLVEMRTALLAHLLASQPDGHEFITGEEKLPLYIVGAFSLSEEGLKKAGAGILQYESVIDVWGDLGQVDEVDGLLTSLSVLLPDDLELALANQFATVMSRLVSVDHLVDQNPWTEVMGRRGMLRTRWTVNDRS